MYRIQAQVTMGMRSLQGTAHYDSAVLCPHQRGMLRIFPRDIQQGMAAHQRISMPAVKVHISDDGADTNAGHDIHHSGRCLAASKQHESNLSDSGTDTHAGQDQNHLGRFLAASQTHESDLVTCQFTNLCTTLYCREKLNVISPHDHASHKALSTPEAFFVNRECSTSCRLIAMQTVPIVSAQTVTRLVGTARSHPATLTDKSYNSKQSIHFEFSVSDSENRYA